MNAQLLAIDAARARGAKLSEPAPAIEPTLEPIPARIEPETLAALGKIIVEATVEAVAAQKDAPIDIAPLAQRLQQLVEKADPAVDPELLAVLASLSAALATQAQRTDVQLSQIVRAIAGLAAGQQKIIATLNATVIPEYDSDGRVIAARRMPIT